MIIKGLIDEDFVNYHIPAMFIASSKCDWKCCIEYGKTIDMCQNSPLYESKSIELSAEEIFRRYFQFNYSCISHWWIRTNATI